MEDMVQPSAERATKKAPNMMRRLQLIIAGLVVLAGAVYYFGFSGTGADEVPPSLSPDTASLQGFLNKDVSIDVDGIFTNYEFVGFSQADKDAFNLAKAGWDSNGITPVSLPTNAQNKGIHYVFANEETTLEKVLKSMDPTATAVAVATYDAEEGATGKFVFTPNTYPIYNNNALTRHIALDNLKDYKIAKGQVVYTISFKNTAAYNLHDGKTWADADYDICATTKDGWYNFAISEATSKDLLPLFEPCIGKIKQIYFQTNNDPVDFEQIYRNTSNGQDPISDISDYTPTNSIAWVQFGDGYGDVEVPTPGDEITQMGPVRELKVEYNEPPKEGLSISWKAPAGVDVNDLKEYVVESSLDGKVMEKGKINIDLDTKRLIVAGEDMTSDSSFSLTTGNHGDVINLTTSGSVEKDATFAFTVVAVDKETSISEKSTVEINVPAPIPLNSGQDGGEAVDPQVTPLPPTNFKVTAAGDDFLSFSWTAPANADESPIVSYRVDCEPDDSALSTIYAGGISGTTYTMEIETAIVGSKVSCYVTAYNKDMLWSIKSNTASGTAENLNAFFDFAPQEYTLEKLTKIDTNSESNSSTTDPPTATQPDNVENLEAITFVSSGSTYIQNYLIVSWDTPEEKNVSYNIQVKTADSTVIDLEEFDSSDTIPSPDPAYAVGTFGSDSKTYALLYNLRRSEAVNYDINVSVVNQAGLKSEKETVTYEVPPLPPKAVTNLQLVRSSSENTLFTMYLTWDDPAETEITKYIIGYSNNLTGAEGNNFILREESQGDEDNTYETPYVVISNEENKAYIYNLLSENVSEFAIWGVNEYTVNGSTEKIIGPFASVEVK